MQACAGERRQQAGTWINGQMIDAYMAMHQAGLAHSLECWNADGKLVGGLYGIALGRVFFGESMFSLEANCSKLCLKFLAESGKYELIDCQLPTDHLHSLGAIDIPRDKFDAALDRWA